jgi:hypothetical protein
MRRRVAQFSLVLLLAVVVLGAAVLADRAFGHGWPRECLPAWSGGTSSDGEPPRSPPKPFIDWWGTCEPADQ